MRLQTFGPRKDKHSHMDALVLERSFYMPLPGRQPTNCAESFSKVRNYKVVGFIDLGVILLAATHIGLIWFCFF